MKRRLSKKIKVGNIFIGGDSDILVQSMTNTSSQDYEKTLSQMCALQEAGCDIIRMTVPDMQSVITLGRIKDSGKVSMPIVADIHFDYRLAIESAAAGADKIRINPGNIGSDDRVHSVVLACREHGIPIRIGVNGGSLEKDVLAKYNSPCAEALAESALYHASLLEKFDFDDIILSLKSSDVATMIKANEILAEKCDYPLHIGVTEAGSAHAGLIKNAMGIGALLCRGIGDTLRVSLTADPIKEVEEGHNILRALSLDRGNYVTVTSCPTCGRTNVDLIGIVEELERRAPLECRPSRPVHAAVMGCVVNGPGEAREADIGIAGGKGEGLLFMHGKSVCKVPENKIIDRLIEEINKF